MGIHIAAMQTSLASDLQTAAKVAREIGFTHLDVIAKVGRPQDDLEALAENGLFVCCTALGRDLPDGYELDSPNGEIRTEARKLIERQITDSAFLGASRAYLVPPAALENLPWFSHECCRLADLANARGIRLCVEHFPGKALASAASTLSWLGGLDHPNLALLLDVGHCLISGEDPALVIHQAKGQIGYVHLDDNDGVADVHWPLLEGQLTLKALKSVLMGLEATGYGGSVALELNPRFAREGDGMREGKKLLDSLIENLPVTKNI